MALTLLEENLDIIQGLADLPNSEDGLDPDQLKAKFDEAVNIIKHYLNKVLIPQIESDIDAASKGISSGEGISGEKLVDGSVTGAKLADDSISSTKIASKAVTTEKIADKAVSRTQLSEDATTLKTEDFPNKVVPNRALDDAAVTNVKLADGAVITSKLADDAVTTDKIADDAVTRDKLADDALYSPIDERSGSTNLTVAQLGKTIQSAWNADLDLILTQANSQQIPVGAEFAVLRWGAAASQSVKITSSGVRFVFAGETTFRSNISLIITDTFSMVALKKITSKASGGDAWLVTGNVEVVS